MKKRYESVEKPDKCPKCGAPVYRIEYGFPTMSEEEYFKNTECLTHCESHCESDSFYSYS